MHIAEHQIAPGQPCFVIAEAGVNHNGSLKLAKELVKSAKQAGADAVKFQTFKAERVVTQRTQKAAYQEDGDPVSNNMYEMLKSLELSYDEFRELAQYCKECEILFMSKGHEEDIEFLIELGVPALKVDSAAIIYYSLLRKVAGYGVPVILSTGGSTLGEIEKALAILSDNGGPQVCILHCTTAYPAPYDQINLRAMDTLRQAFGLPIGYSDHSLGIEVPIAAASRGAMIIEKHFTLDKNMAGPDHKASLEPEELKRMIDGIRIVEASLGVSRKGPTDLERENLKVMRRSLVAEVDIAKGEVFTSEKLAFKRPADGLGQEMMEVVLGRQAVCDIRSGDPITWDVVGGR